MEFDTFEKAEAIFRGRKCKSNTFVVSWSKLVVELSTCGRCIIPTMAVLLTVQRIGGSRIVVGDQHEYLLSDLERDGQERSCCNSMRFLIPPPLQPLFCVYFFEADSLFFSSC